MKKIAIFCAEGFEEIEGLTVVDILRRAGLEINMVSITDSMEVTGSHGIKLMTDVCIGDISFADYDMLVLPGGMPGTRYLGACDELCDNLIDFNKNNRYIAAICAAPTVLGSLGILKDKKACCYEGMEDGLNCMEVSKEQVVVSGNVITSRGMGTAIAFALKIVEIFCGIEKANELGRAIIYL